MTSAPLADPSRRPRTARLTTLAGVTLGTAAVCALVTAPTAAAAPAHRPTAAPAHDRTAAPADRQIAAAAGYVAALVDHDPSSVPLHPGGDTVTADYLLDAGAGAPLATARVHETFGLVNGLIKTIVADIAATPALPAP